VLCDACFLSLPSSIFGLIVLIDFFYSAVQNDALPYDASFILFVFGPVFSSAVVLKYLEFMFFPPSNFKFRTHSELHAEHLGYYE
jgi:hypothetical protein